MKTAINTHTPCDILDTLYSVAYWLTANTNEAEELVRAAYRESNDDTSLNALCSALRYHAHKTIEVTDGLETEALDIRFTVLLSEIADLRHNDIATIIDQPLSVVRYWLLIGREQLALEHTLRASA